VCVRAHPHITQEIQAELSFARELYAAHPQWPVLDVTFRGVEETVGGGYACIESCNYQRPHKIRYPLGMWGGGMRGVEEAEGGSRG